MGTCNGKLFFHRQKNSSKTFCNHLDLEMNLVHGKAKHLQKTSFNCLNKSQSMHMQLWKLAPSANCQDKAAGISVTGFATGFPYTVCVIETVL